MRRCLVALTLAAAPQQPAGEDWHALLDTNLLRASRLIKDFKQTAVHQTSERLCDFDVMETLRALLASLHPVTRRVPVRPMLGGPRKLPARGYPGALMQVLTNLIMNSVNHAFREVASPAIVIDVREGEYEWELVYSDNGVGVPLDVQPRIFEPFFTTRRGRGGTGLGLNIVYTVVTQRMGGQLAFWSRPGQGVRLHLRLPREEARVDDRREVAGALAGLRLRELRLQGQWLAGTGPQGGGTLRLDEALLDAAQARLTAQGTVDVAASTFSGSTTLQLPGAQGRWAGTLAHADGQGDLQILQDIRFAVGAGESVAIVGPSGGGKTTLLKLMLGIHAPQGGEVRVGGLPLADSGHGFATVVSVPSDSCG